MALKKEDNLLVFHYLGNRPYAATVADLGSEKMTVRISEKNFKVRPSVGEPLVVAYMDDGQAIVKGFDIEHYNGNDTTIELKPDILDGEAAKRLYERMPISHYAEIKSYLGSKRSDALIKNISNHGLMIYTKVDCPVGEKLDVTIFLNKKMLSLEGEIVRRMEDTNFIKYGITINSNSYHLIRNAEQLFDFFKEDYIKKINMEFSMKNESLNLSYENLAFGLDDARKLTNAIQKLDTILKRTQG